MNTKKWVISLGGSQIVPDEVNDEFLKEFKGLIESHPTHKFVVVTGGGSTARRYISAIRRLGKKTKAQSLEGIAVTRLHAGFMARFFGKRANSEIPTNMKKVKNLLNKNQVVFCGGLRYEKENTSDGTAAKIARYIDAPFINLTNTKGLYTADPRKDKKARFIPKITWKKFYSITEKIKYQAGQHFVLDKAAAKIIMDDKIPTYIVGGLKPIDNILKKKKFSGTLISG